MAAPGQDSGTDRPDADILAFVRRHERFVRAYLRSLGCPEDRVDDLAQDSFLKVLAHRNDEPPPGRAYLATVAANLHRNELRREAAAPVRRELVEEAWAEFHRSDEGAEWIAALRYCVDELPERTREALRLRYGLDVARDEIGARLQLSLGGVKSLLERGKGHLRECVRRRLGSTPPGAVEATP